MQCISIHRHEMMLNYLNIITTCVYIFLPNDEKDVAKNSMSTSVDVPQRLADSC